MEDGFREVIYPEEHKLAGHKFEGEFANGLRTGYGKMTYPNGDVFIGDFDEDSAYFGTFYFKSPKFEGDVYEGEFQDGTFNGKGVYKYLSKNHTVSGDVYKGEFKDGKRHGMGVYHYVDGATEEGFWTNGWITGDGKLTFPNGDSFVGNLDHGVPHKSGHYTWSNGENYSGNYSHGKRTGSGKYTHLDGTVTAGEFIDGKLNMSHVGQVEEIFRAYTVENLLEHSMKLKQVVVESESIFDKIRDYIFTKIDDPYSDISIEKHILEQQKSREYSFEINIPIKLPPGTNRGYVANVIDECINILENSVGGAMIIPPFVGTWEGIREPNVKLLFDFRFELYEKIPSLVREIITIIQTKNKQMCVRVALDATGGRIFDLIGGNDKFGIMQDSFGYPDPDVYLNFDPLTFEDKSGHDAADLGAGAQRAGRIGSSEKYLQNALDIFQKSNDYESQTCVLLDLANNYDIQGKLDKAEYHYLQVLEIVETHNPNDLLTVAKVYGNLGLISGQKGDNKRALGLINEGIEIIERSLPNDTKETLKLLNNLASIHLKLDNYKETRTLCESVIQRINHNDDYLDELFIAMGNMAIIEINDDNYDLAIDLLEEVSDYWYSVGDLEQYGVTSGVIGDLYYRDGLYEPGKTWYSKQMDVAEEFNSPALRASALYGLGVIEMEFDVQKSIRYLKQSLNLEVDLRDKASTCAALFEAHTIISDWASAEHYCNEWLTFATQVGDREGAIRAMVNQALSKLQGINDEEGVFEIVEKAEFIFDEAKRKAEQLGDEELIRFVKANSIEYEELD